MRVKPAERTQIFMVGGDQAVRILNEFRFAAGEVYIRRDPQTGDVILSQIQPRWDEIFAALDRAGVPADFLADR